ncbi:MAG TPA: molybdopterin molybdenumtransferase [Cyanobacteria bacterium UBA11369]|nr:molybdopterin molybdenumtransferase [Cyanobacteria bacterium UBA11369]
MLSVQQAEEIIFKRVQPLDALLDAEVVDLLAAFDRILAMPVTSDLDFPHWDNSAMDGYAVRSADVEGCSASQPAVLEIVEEIAAGKQPQHTIKPGQAARIFTGAMMPEGADTVVMQEVTRQEGSRVVILAAPKPQAFVRYRASYYQAGTPLLMPGIPLFAPEIGILASAQCTQVSVYRRPRVAILSTGDELVTPDRPLQPGQIVDSNQYAMAAIVAQSGGIPLLLGIVADQPEALKNAIASALTSADIVVSSGGVSVGDYDYVDRILESLGAEIHLRAIAVKPGKPLTFATVKRGEGERTVLYFGLPGNPASSLVTFWRFVQPALKKLSGLARSWKPMFVQARAGQDLRSDGKRETYLWGQMHLKDGGYEFQLAGGSQSSGNLINLARTNGLAVLPVGITSINAGEAVQVLQVGLPLGD